MALPLRSHAGSSEDELIDALLAGRDSAWPAFVALAHPIVVTTCKKRGYDRTDEDASREVAVRVIERLAANEFAALAAYAQARAKYPDMRFARWLGVLTHHAYVDHVRARPEVHRARDAGGRRLARTELVQLADGHAVHEPRYEPDLVRVMRLLADFPPVDRQALVLWLAGHSSDEIAARLGLPSGDDASRILHATRQRLRRLVREGVA